MSKWKHTGSQPTYPLELIKFKKKIYIEEYPNGYVKLWNKRSLKKGCGLVLDESELKGMRGCIYCPRCDEWFNLEQWGLLDEDT